MAFLGVKNMAYFKSYLHAFSITAILLFVLQPLAIKIGLVDQPNHRKQHKNQVPLIGGMAMFSGFLLTVLLIDLPLPGCVAFLPVPLF
jgi:UDP-GlcNAc:undecaprenyl-phosphate GlcNAc-1-phosphate transferase